MIDRPVLLARQAYLRDRFRSEPWEWIARELETIYAALKEDEKTDEAESDSPLAGPAASPR